MTGTSFSDLSALKTTVDTMPIALSWADSADGTILYMNHAFTRLFGYALADVPTVVAWFDLYIVRQQKEHAIQRWKHFLERRNSDEARQPEVEIQVRCKDGSIKTLLHEAVLLPDLKVAVATFVDITMRKQGELLNQSLLIKERQSYKIVQEVLLNHSQEMIVVSPVDRSRRYVSPGVLQLTGFTQEEYLECEPIDLVHSEDWALYLDVIFRAYEGEIFQQRRYRTMVKGGGYRWIEAQVRASVDPKTKVVLGYIANIRDIANQKEHEEEMAGENKRLAELAGIDELTGISNRRTFNHALAAECVRKRRSALSTAVILMDVDNYKSYNDHFGHLKGDACLKDIARAMKSLALRSNDVVARFGGDEFVLLLPHTDLQGAEMIVKSLIVAITSLAIPHPGTPEAIVTVSAGVACCPDSLPAIQSQLLLHADQALYAAKAAGRNRYSVSLCEEVTSGFPISATT